MNRRLYQVVSALPLIFTSSQASPPEIAPAIPTLAKIYDTAPDGLELYEVQSLAVEPTTGALWVKYGSKDETPIRFDRKTGTSKVIGRVGSGPNEYPVPAAILGIAPGGSGEVAIWDGRRMAVVWVNAAGTHTRLWPARTSAAYMGHVYTDLRGRAYVGQPGSLIPGRRARTNVVIRVDSAGFRDTLRLPLTESPAWIWNCLYSSNGGRGQSRYAISFAPTLKWGVDAQGRAFAALTDSNFVAVIDGARTRRLVFPNSAEPLTAAERTSASKGLDAIEAACAKQQGTFDGPRPPIPAFRPQISDVRPEMNGGIAVVRSVPCSRVPTWRAPETRAAPGDTVTRCPIVERFDASGTRLRPFTLAIGDRLMVLRADTAWVLRMANDGLSSIRELRIPPR